MTSEGRVSLRLADVKRYGVPYLMMATFGKQTTENKSLCIFQREPT